MTHSEMRLLIAGCGDLGLRVARHALQNTAQRVWGLKRTVEHHTQPFPDFEWCVADLSKPETMSTLPQGITHLVFCAAPNERTEQAYRSVYIKGLQNIVSTADNPALKRVVFISSTAVYGENNNEWVDEDTPVLPKNFNGHVLVEAERWLEKYGKTHQLETISLRLSGIYGPGRTFLLDQLKRGQVGAPSRPTHWTNRIHVEDAAAAIVHLLSITNPAPLYNVTDSTPLPMRTLYETLAQLVGGPIPPEAEAPKFVGSKRLSNARLLGTGFKLRWPDCREAYAEIIQSG